MKKFLKKLNKKATNTTVVIGFGTIVCTGVSIWLYNVNDGGWVVSLGMTIAIAIVAILDLWRRW